MKQITIAFGVLIAGLGFFTYANAAPLTGNVVVIKKVINDNGGKKVSGDFTMNLYIKDVTRPEGEPLALSETFPGAAAPGVTKVLVPGQYKVDEVEIPGYTATYSADCQGTVLAGQTKTCTITNNDKPAKLTVIKNVVGSDKPPGDFTIDVYAKDITRPDDEPPVLAATFPGANASGTTITISAGPYEVNEPSAPGYTQTYSEGCKGVAEPGQEIICIVTNTFTQGGGGDVTHTDSNGGGSGGGGGGGDQRTGSNNFSSGGDQGGPLLPNSKINGLVAGASTINPNLSNGDPEILGASTTLPRTGLDFNWLISLFTLSFLISPFFTKKISQV